jgi:hypothetical protein
MFTARVMAQHATHTAALLELPKTSCRPADLAPVLESRFLQADSQHFHDCRLTIHPRRQHRESGRYGSLPYFREGHG